ncbi:hypothetical protein [Streptomyces bobili]
MPLFAEPPLALGLGNGGEGVVSDLDESVTLRRVRPEHRTADAGVFVDADAGGAESATACIDGDLASFEVAEEFLPFIAGDDAAFLAGARNRAAGD